MQVKSFFHPGSSTFSYVVSDKGSRKAAIIDSVLDYDQNSAHTSTKYADMVIDYVRSEKLEVEWILETHAHADHISAAPYLKQELGGRLGIGEGIKTVQKTFSGLFNLSSDFSVDGVQFDYLFKNDEQFSIGELSAQALYTPGHTNDSVTYLIGDAAFVGDTLFMPDYGSARCDFPGGDAAKLYQSVQKIYALPDSTKLYLCHDYVPEGVQREVIGWSTVEEQKTHNKHINVKTGEEQFVSMRNTRDAKLSLPQLIIPAVQVNIRAGEMPEPEDNGVSYLKIPLNTFGH